VLEEDQDPKLTAILASVALLKVRTLCFSFADDTTE